MKKGATMQARWWAALVGVALCSGAARADMVTPGFKSRELRVVIDNLGDYPNYDFYLVAAWWLIPEEQKSGPYRPDRPPQITAGETHRPGYPARFSHDWMLVAVPRRPGEGRGQADWDALAPGTPGVRISNRVRLAEPSSVTVFEPNDYEVHHFRVELAGDQLTLTPGLVEQGSKGFDSWAPSLLLVAMLTAAVGGLGFWLARKVRRAARTTPAQSQATPD